MNSARVRVRFAAHRVALAAALVVTSSIGIGIASSAQGLDAAHSRFYSVHNLVSDGFVPADHSDSDLKNAWGLVFTPTSPAWVADNKTGVATLYNGLGVKISLVVTIPPPAGGTPPSAPTGIVASGGSDFVVSVGTLSGPSRFIFSTEDGTISGWAPNVEGTHAILVVDNSASNAIYKGLALAGNGSARFLYATDFHNNKIDVFDSTFHPATLAGSFTDPNLPAGFAPFGIQNILGNLYVTYAKQDENAVDDVKGVGLGFVDVFDADGNLIRRLASRGKLNAPWGLALAPADFGRFSNMLLVGNFGDGRIHAYDLNTGNFRGQLRTAPGQPLVIDGLWALVFGNGVLNQPVNALFFTAGPGDEEHGIYGRIDPVPGGSGDDSDDSDAS
jgi:uncharacterized protein (TIGR03118 family)